MGETVEVRPGQVWLDRRTDMPVRHGAGQPPTHPVRVLKQPGWEPTTVQVVIGIIGRANREGDQRMTDQPTPPPEDIYRAVAVARAIRWGYVKTLGPGELADYIRKQASDDNVRADADEVWLVAQRVFGQTEEGADR